MTNKKLTSGVVFLQQVTDGKKRFSRSMRREPTCAERLLWQRVRGNGIAGLKFRRQQVIEGFIVDFFCHRAKLVVELDGEVHDTEERKKEDEARRMVFEARGLTELRFRNEAVIGNIEAVIEEIEKTVQSKLAED